MPRLNRLLFKSGSKGQEGFTLIEVLIALTVFAVGLLALAGMQITGIRGNATSHAVMAKSAVANGVLEEFLAMNIDNPRLTDETPEVRFNEEILGAGNLVATVVVDASIVGLSEITVTVTGPGSTNDVVKTVMKRRR